MPPTLVATGVGRPCRDNGAVRSRAEPRSQPDGVVLLCRRFIFRAGMGPVRYGSRSIPRNLVPMGNPSQDLIIYPDPDFQLYMVVRLPKTDEQFSLFCRKPAYFSVPVAATTLC